MTEYFIKEQSFVAYIAAKRLKSGKMAIVINRTIHLHKVGKDDFLNNQKWLLHELKHIEQYRRYGAVRFIVLYLYETLKHGYANNRFEVEARNAETEVQLLDKFEYSEKPLRHSGN